jgi:hypothetical protein
MVKGSERHDFQSMPEWLEWRAALPAGHDVTGANARGLSAGEIAAPDFTKKFLLNGELYRCRVYFLAKTPFCGFCGQKGAHPD